MSLGVDRTVQEHITRWYNAPATVNEDGKQPVLSATSRRSYLHNDGALGVRTFVDELFESPSPPTSPNLLLERRHDTVPFFTSGLTLREVPQSSQPPRSSTQRRVSEGQPGEHPKAFVAENDYVVFDYTERASAEFRPGMLPALGASVSLSSSSYRRVSDNKALTADRKAEEAMPRANERATTASPYGSSTKRAVHTTTGENVRRPDSAATKAAQPKHTQHAQPPPEGGGDTGVDPGKVFASFLGAGQRHGDERDVPDSWNSRRRPSSRRRSSEMGSIYSNISYSLHGNSFFNADERGLPAIASPPQQDSQHNRHAPPALMTDLWWSHPPASKDGKEVLKSDYTVIEAQPSAVRLPAKRAQLPSLHSSVSSARTASTSSSDSSQRAHEYSLSGAAPASFAVFRRTTVKNSSSVPSTSPGASRVNPRRNSLLADNEDSDDSDDGAYDRVLPSFTQQRQNDRTCDEASHNGQPSRLQRTRDLPPSKWAYVAKFATQVLEGRQQKLGDLARREYPQSGLLSKVNAPSVFRLTHTSEDSDDDEEEVELSQVFDENGHPMVEPTMSNLFSENMSSDAEESEATSDESSTDDDECNGTTLSQSSPTNGAQATYAARQPPLLPRDRIAVTGVGRAHPRMARPEPGTQQRQRQQQFARSQVSIAGRSSVHDQTRPTQTSRRNTAPHNPQRHRLRTEPHLPKAWTPPQGQREQPPPQPVTQLPVGVSHPSPPEPYAPCETGARPLRREVRMLQGPRPGERMQKADEAPKHLRDAATYIAFTPEFEPPEPQPDLRGPKLNGKPHAVDFERLFGLSLSKVRWVSSPRRVRGAPSQKATTMNGHRRAPAADVDSPSGASSSSSSAEPIAKQVSALHAHRRKR